MIARALLGSWRRFGPAAWRRPATAALALLAAVIVAAALGVARVDLGHRTRAERSLIDAASVAARTITVRSVDGFTGGAGSIAADGREQLYRVISRSVPIRSADEGWGRISYPAAPVVSDPAGAFAAPGGAPVEADLAYLDTLPRHARLVAGRWPAPQASAEPLDAVVSNATAALMNLRVGSVFTLTMPLVGRTPMPEKLRVAGVFEPLDAPGLFWAANSFLLAPVHQKPLSAPDFWSTGIFVGAGQVDGLPSFLADANLTWTFPIDSDTGDADHADALVAGVDRVELAAEAQARDGDRGTVFGVRQGADLPPLPVSITSGLRSVLVPFGHAQSVEELELAMPLAGLALIAAVAAALLAAAAVADRTVELAARRARGSSARQAAGRVLADGLVTALPAAALGFCAGLAVPGRTPSGMLWTAAVISVLIALAPAAGVAWLEAVRRRALRSAGRLHTRAGIGARRWIAQGALGLLCAGGLELIRSRGLSPGGDVDPYAAAAPVLAAGLAALVTINMLPPVLRVLLRLSARRGVAGLLGLTRAAAAPFPVQAADVVLTAGICTAGTTFALSRLALAGGGGELRTATRSTFGFLAWLTVGAAFGAVALAAWLGAAAARRVASPLGAIGLSGTQARAAAALELLPALVAGVVGGVAAMTALARWTGPALGRETIPIRAADLITPVLTAVVTFTAAQAVGIIRGGTRRDLSAALRIGA